MTTSPCPQPSPAVFCARRTSRSVANLLGKLASDPESLCASMLQHLRAIEDIETRIATQGIPQEEIVNLVALGHSTLNEIHRLHLRNEMRRLYVAHASALPAGASLASIR